MKLTPQQEAAVHARGDVVVMAGAGTGKTRALVERAVHALLHPVAPVRMDQILMVTFTEAAAAEMRHRIRARLESALDANSSDARIQTQLALLDTAHISTLHSFCFELVRQHFYELGLDPHLTVLAEEQSRLVASQVLDAMFKHHYSADASEPVRSLIRDLYDGWEKPVRDAILALHDFTQTRPAPARWLAGQQHCFAQTKPERWLDWLQDGARAWRSQWLNTLESNGSKESSEARGILQQLELDQPAWRSALRQTIDNLRNIKGTRKTPPKPLDKLMAGAEFLHSVCPADGEPDPLEQDWSWTRGHMSTFLQLGEEFAQSFERVKRDTGVLDFHDLEQLALRLLWDATSQQPTSLARHWQDRLELVFIDEYQDINAAQDLILRALSRDGPRANRFMVGDVKQSIYRFRQADPRIFQKYAASWREAGGAGKTLYLSENFRSHGSLLSFVNALFDRLMWPVMGGIRYDEEARLRFGAPASRAPMAQGNSPRVEVHLRLTGNDADTDAAEDNDDAANGPAALTTAEQEARLVASRLRDLRAEQWQVWDESAGSSRPVQWSDMVVLLRAPAGKVESYAKEFSRAGIPLQAKRVGFYETTEVQDLLSLLVLLDNPQQDIPCLAVLRSPLVGLDVDELARIRLAEPKARFWAALSIWRRRQGSPNTATGTIAKVDRFLADYDRWRSMARHASLVQRLETILADTHYLDWLLTLPRGEHRRANVHQLLALARQFDEVHRQGLYRFLDFIEAQKNSSGDREPAPLEAADAVRLMSIHQSKGLEFPVVAIPDLAKKFNLENGTGGILLDDAYGPCPLLRPPGSRRKYPSLPRWLAQQRQRNEILGEELRLLYVAATRARDLLILTGTCARTTAEKWAAAELAPDALPFGNSYLHWLGPWLSSQAPDWIGQPSGESPLWRWQIHDQDSRASSPPPSPSNRLSPPAPAPEQVADLRHRLAWQYPLQAAVHEPAKTSVTALRRRASEADETEARPLLRAESIPFVHHPGGLSAAAVGTAHHLFAQHVLLDSVGDPARLEQERERMTLTGLLTPEEAQAIDLGAVLAFWQSPVGQRFLSQREQLQRELPFTIRLDRADLTRLQIPGFTQMPEEDFIVAQGVIDLAVLRPMEIWLLDFKTDRIQPGDIEIKTQLYAPQLRLYAHALERIHRRPVTCTCLHFLAVNRTIETIGAPSDRQLTLF